MPVFVLLLIAVLAEVAVLITVGTAIGALATIGLLILASVIGMAMLRRQGAQTLTAFTGAMRNRRDPQPEMVDGMLIGVAGALVLFPGFVSDLLALALLFPPTRRIVRKRLLSRAEQSLRRGPSVFVINTVQTGDTVNTRTRTRDDDQVDDQVIDGVVESVVIDDDSRRP